MAESDVLTGTGGRPVAEPSVPTGLEIPAIGVRTAVVPIGPRPDRIFDTPGIDVPAGWMHTTPTPGEPGAAVIVGPADSAENGPAVFHRLRLLMPGDRIVVRRADGGELRFAVTAVGLYPHDAFPGELLAGPGEEPELTLVTDAATWNRGRHVVFSRLVS